RAAAHIPLTAEHPEAVGQRPRMRVEEGLLLDRIALHATDVPPRHEQSPALVVAHLADANRAFGQRAAVVAGKASQPAVAQGFVEIAWAPFATQHLSQCGHGALLLYDAVARGLRRSPGGG